jgi:hypothetical protein
MRSRGRSRVACGALAAALSLGGCHGLDVVGMLAADAGTLVTNPDAGLQNAADAAPVAIDDCQAGDASGLDETTVAALLQDSEAQTVRWLYPYDGTVFPGGLAAPMLMWDDGGVAEDAVYVHVHSSSFDYAGCMKPTGPGQLQLPQSVWALADAATSGAADPFTLELRVLSGGRLLATAAEHVVVATGSLSGSVFYMTIGTGLGSIARVPAGQSAQPVLSVQGCAGCHSVSSNGSRLVAYASGTGTAYGLAGGTSPPMVLSPAPGGESPGLTPDGALYVASAHPSGVGPKSYGAGVMTAGLYETATGQLVPGTGVPTGAMVPAFSPDGSMLAFNDFAIASGKGLALMDFSESARTASNYTVLFSSSSSYPAWPSFLPDGRAIVFQLGASSDFSGGGIGILGATTNGSPADLYLAGTRTQGVTLLAQAMGFASATDVASNITYLPFGTSEAHQNYAPSASPVASGGYAWVFFDSMRHYGNASFVRAIWGAAVDLATDGSYESDPSHPAFFLPGQGPGTGNFRAVAARDP